METDLMQVDNQYDTDILKYCTSLVIIFVFVIDPKDAAEAFEDRPSLSCEDSAFEINAKTS